MKYIKYKNIAVSYEQNLHGGGMRFGQQYLQVVKEKFGHVSHIYEFCSGPGFIGFSLLANNLCDKLTLADINPRAVKVAKETIKNNNLESRVNVYLSNCLDNIPESEKWDLVVGNPPHVFCPPNDERQKDIILYDPNFEIHRKFYRDIKKFLKPGGSVMLQEHTESTNVEDFQEMIEANGLKIIEVFAVNPPPDPSSIKPKPSKISLLRKVFNPVRVYKFIKRRMFPVAPRHYYFIWAKLS